MNRLEIDWTALGLVFGVSLVATVALVGVFTLGVVLSSAPGREGGSPSLLRRAAACGCYALCAAAVAYGIRIVAA